MHICVWWSSIWQRCRFFCSCDTFQPAMGPSTGTKNIHKRASIPHTVLDTGVAHLWQSTHKGCQVAASTALGGVRAGGEFAAACSISYRPEHNVASIDIQGTQSMESMSLEAVAITLLHSVCALQLGFTLGTYSGQKLPFLVPGCYQTQFFTTNTPVSSEIELDERIPR